MKILFLTIGDETVASTRSRVYGYLPFLAEEGIACMTISFTSKSKCRRILGLKKDNFLQYIFEICYKIYVIAKLFVMSKRCEIIYVQKVILPRIVWQILQKFNKRTIFDFDDAIFIYRNIVHLLKSARYIVVSNKTLKAYAAEYNEKVYELISPVNVNHRLPLRRNSFITIGWIGSPETSKYLYPLIPVFKNLKKKFSDINIEFMGAEKNDSFLSLDINIMEWSLEGEKRYLEKLDIGIMPLEDSEWSRSKGGYKLLLYMSMGTPCIATPIGINKEIIKEGVTGFFASSEQEWLDKLTIFIENKELRKEMGKNAWLRAREYFSYNAIVPKFLNILKECLLLERA